MHQPSSPFLIYLPSSSTVPNSNFFFTPSPLFFLPCKFLVLSCFQHSQGKFLFLICAASSFHLLQARLTWGKKKGCIPGKAQGSLCIQVPKCWVSQPTTQNAVGAEIEFSSWNLRYLKELKDLVSFRSLCISHVLVTASDPLRSWVSTTAYQSFRA